MMDYYALKLSSLVKKPIHINGLDILASTASFDSYNDLSVYYFNYVENETEITELIASPIFLISKTIRDLFALYDTEMRFKGIQLFSLDKEDIQAPLYFIPNITKVDCLSDKVRINPNGTIDTIILAHNKVKDLPIIRIDNITQQKVIINEDVAESLLRRNLYGIGLEKVEVI